MVALGKLISDDYFGLGINTIYNIVNPYLQTADFVNWYDPILKTIFTALSLGSGGSGGIITPIFYVGSTSGAIFGHLFNENTTFFAALGLVSVLAGTTNTPIASIIMGVELFGTNMGNYLALSVIISFLITGHRSVFSSQKIAFNKADNIKVEGKNLTESKIDLNLKDIDRIRKLKTKFNWQNKRRLVKKRQKDKLNN